MNFIQISSQIITFLRNECPESSLESWVKWRETVVKIYEFDFNPSKINTFINEGIIASKKNINKESDIHDLVDSLDVENQKSVLELLTLFIQLERNENNEIKNSYFNKVREGLVSSCSISKEDEKELNNTVNNWLEQSQDDRLAITIKTPATVWLVTFDFMVRWLLLWLYQTGKLEPFSDIVQIDTVNVFYWCQFFFIPILTFGIAFIRKNYVKNKTIAVLNKLQLKKVKIRPLNNPWEIALIVIYGLLGGFIYFEINESPSIVATLFLTAAQLWFLSFLYRKYSMNIPSVNYITSQIDRQNESEFLNQLNHEENDVEIIKLEVKLRSLNEQMDAFVLEAALFGALAFSGFLSIISSDIFSIEYISSFSENVERILFHAFNFKQLPKGLINETLFSKPGLLSLLSYLTLFCSIFFLSVISSRLRFNDLTDLVDKSLQLSKNFNQREEELIKSESKGDLSKMVNKFSYQIRKQLRLGNLSYKEIEPIMAYMKFFRTLGISTFFIIIVTGGLFVSLEIAILLFLISMLSIVYFKIDWFTAKRRQLFILTQEFYYKASEYIHYISWGLIGISAVLRSFDLFIGDLVMFIGFSMLFLHYLVSLILPESYDFQGDVKFETNVSTNEVLRRLMKVGLSLFFLGFMFKAFNWPAASVLQILGLLMLSIYYLLSPKNTGIKWYNLLIGITMVSWFLSIMFKFQHWSGTPALRITFFLLFTTSVIIGVIKKVKLSNELKKLGLLVGIITMVTFFDFGLYAIRNVKLDYSEFKEQDHYLSIRNTVFLDIENGGYYDAKQPDEVDSLQVNAEKLTQLIVDMNREGAFNWIISEVVILDNTPNPVLYPELKKWISGNFNEYQGDYAYSLAIKATLKFNEIKDAKELLQEHKKFIEETGDLGDGMEERWDLYNQNKTRIKEASKNQ